MTDDRIAALEAKIASAQIELAQIKAGEAPPPPRPQISLTVFRVWAASNNSTKQWSLWTASSRWGRKKPSCAVSVSTKRWQI
jgi:hypothetical protein